MRGQDRATQEQEEKKVEKTKKKLQEKRDGTERR